MLEGYMPRWKGPEKTREKTSPPEELLTISYAVHLPHLKYPKKRNLSKKNEAMQRNEGVTRSRREEKGGESKRKDKARGQV